MNKREFIKRAIEEIRSDIVLRNKYEKKRDWKMYGHMLTVIDAKISLLHMTGVLTTKQYFMLYDIVNK